MALTLFLSGDVMTGRGVDQILAHPSAPDLHEPVVRSALGYVELAEQTNGPIPRLVDGAYVWGAALDELDRRKPDARIINLETAVTTSDDAEDKGINYRMHPANVGVLSAAAIDCATLANNHVLDWGVRGLFETLDTLAHAGIRVAGAGRGRIAAESPAIIDFQEGRRLLVFAFGASDSGVPPDWSADDGRPGVSWLSDYSPYELSHVAGLVAASKRPGDVVVASIHWGANWGFEIPHEHRAFAHALIDEAGVDVVCGHSSHHVKAIELHRERLILYGCGDFLNDYEGIAGTPAAYRDDLSVMYFPRLGPTGELLTLDMVPLRIRHFRLDRPTESDLHWLLETLDRECRRFGGRVVEENGAFRFRR